MRFEEFEKVISGPRMSRYVNAVQGDTRKAMTLYRLNLRLSQQLFTIVSCFEIALRNGIDRHYTGRNGAHWLRNSAMPGGMYSVRNCGKTPQIIQDALRRLVSYSHSKLVAEMEFGFWRYAFAQYNHGYIYKELEKVNVLRNRLAHHEPVCFAIGQAAIDTNYARQFYTQILNLFKWMGIDEGSLLYGVDQLNGTLAVIDSL